MAMTLRLTDADDDLLTALAQAYGGISKQQAALRAIRDQAAQQGQHAEVLRIAEDVQVRYAEALTRLGEGP